MGYPLTFTVCELHFENKYLSRMKNGYVYKLGADAIPTVFNGVKIEPITDQSIELNASLATQVNPVLRSPETTTHHTASKIKIVQVESLKSRKCV